MFLESEIMETKWSNPQEDQEWQQFVTLPAMTPLTSPQFPGGLWDSADSDSRRLTARSSLSTSPCMLAILEKHRHKWRLREHQGGWVNQHHQSQQQRGGRHNHWGWLYFYFLTMKLYVLLLLFNLSSFGGGYKWFLITWISSLVVISEILVHPSPEQCTLYPVCSLLSLTPLPPFPHSWQSLLYHSSAFASPASVCFVLSLFVLFSALHSFIGTEVLVPACPLVDSLWNRPSAGRRAGYHRGGRQVLAPFLAPLALCTPWYCVTLFYLSMLSCTIYLHM